MLDIRGSGEKAIIRRDHRERLQREKANYPITWFDNISSNQRVYNWKFVKLLRKCEYLRSKTKDSKNPMWKALYWICRAKKNRLGVFIGVDIPEGVFDEGLIIHHNGNIVVTRSFEEEGITLVGIPAHKLEKE